MGWIKKKISTGLCRVQIASRKSLSGKRRYAFIGFRRTMSVVMTIVSGKE